MKDFSSLQNTSSVKNLVITQLSPIIIAGRRPHLNAIPDFFGDCVIRAIRASVLGQFPFSDRLGDLGAGCSFILDLGFLASYPAEVISLRHLH